MTDSSARYHGENSARLYGAIERFHTAALRSDDSLFTPGQAIWTRSNLDELYQLIVGNPDESAGSFMDKLHKQLNAASPAVIQLAAELLYVHLLPAWTSSMSAATKRAHIHAVLALLPQPPQVPSDLDAALEQGFARMGTAFNTLRYFYVAFLISVLRAWKGRSAHAREQMLNDPWFFREWLYEQPIIKAQAQREALLHLVHPDTFEPIVSGEQKRQIVDAFREYVSDRRANIDHQLASVRQALSQRFGPSFSFYQRDVAQLWRDKDTPVTPVSSPLSGVLGPALHPYIDLVMHLNAADYSPEEIVDTLGRIDPPIADLRSAPDAEELISDLLLLRLIEPLDGERYRRWEHLGDLTREHLLRYAALTMLLPDADSASGHTLALMLLLNNQASAPAGLLSWYREARLIEDSPDGWQLTADALQPLDAPTPTAQALNTFLRHIEQVRADHGPQLTKANLPHIDQATLNARIAEIQRELLIDARVIRRIYRALIAGRHVILSGPPGTGKTHLAKLLPRILWREEQARPVMPTQPELPPTAPPSTRNVTIAGYRAMVVTATESWGVRDVIGGIVPQLDGESGQQRRLIYGVRHGSLTQAVLANYADYDGQRLPHIGYQRSLMHEDGHTYRGSWLVIDEFTRAPIDAAFGSVLTTLGGQIDATLSVPTDSGLTADVPMPRDFRLIGTLNSFDRHFLNQISEAMKRRFTFIDIMPPQASASSAEQAIAIYRALERLHAHDFSAISHDTLNGRITWSYAGAEITLTRVSDLAADLQTRYQLETSASTPAVLDDCWRIFHAIRVYRQLGTAQAEAVYATLFAGCAVGMSWEEALDSALADVLADQLQVLTKDEQRVLLAYLEHAADSATFTTAVQQIIKRLPAPRQHAHLSQLKQHNQAIHDSSIDQLSADQLQRVFELGPLHINHHGEFAQRLRSYVQERGL